MELAVLDFIQRRCRAPFLDALMPAVTALGDNGAIWIATAAALMLSGKYRRGGLTLSLALAVNLIVCNGILKPLFHRVRPCDINTAVTLLINRPTDYSFPSGHASASFAAAVVIYHINKAWGAAAFLLATLISFSRLYLYVHFPTDALAGALIGAIIGAAAVCCVD